jgi:hypothetical protein
MPLTPKQKVFSRIFARTNSIQKALFTAGLTVSNKNGTSLLNKKEVIDLIRKEQEEALIEKGLKLAVDAHLRLLQDENIKPQVLLQAIKLMYDQSYREQKSETETKQMHEMDFNELNQLIRQLSATNAIDVSPVADSQQTHDDKNELNQ